jgi:hypothetical protein
MRFAFCQADITKNNGLIFRNNLSPLINPSKNKRYSVFPAVNSSKQRITAVGREFTAVDESTPFI